MYFPTKRDQTQIEKKDHVYVAKWPETKPMESWIQILDQWFRVDNKYNLNFETTDLEDSQLVSVLFFLNYYKFSRWMLTLDDIDAALRCRWQNLL